MLHLIAISFDDHCSVAPGHPGQQDARAFHHLINRGASVLAFLAWGSGVQGTEQDNLDAEDKYGTSPDSRACGLSGMHLMRSADLATPLTNSVSLPVVPGSAFNGTASLYPC